MGLWHRAICLISRRCRLFEGDEFTEQLQRQRQESIAAQGEDRVRRARGIEGVFRPIPPTKQRNGHAN